MLGAASCLCGFASVVVDVDAFVLGVRPRLAFNLCKSFARSFARGVGSCSRVSTWSSRSRAVRLGFVLASLSIQWTRSIVRRSN